MGQCARFYWDYWTSPQAADRVVRSLGRRRFAKLRTCLRRIRPRAPHYTEAAFTMAYFGYDVAANVRRLHWAMENLGPAEYVSGIPDTFLVLYRRRRYTPALVALLSTPGDGMLAEEIDDTVEDALAQRPAALLRAALTGRRYFENLVHDVSGAIWIGDASDARRIRKALAHLRRGRDRRLAAGARRLTRRVEVEVKASVEQYH